MRCIEKITTLLSLNQNYSVSYRQGRSNHLSMALIALFFMDADENQLQKFFDAYLPQLEQHSPTTLSIDTTNWQTFLGQNKHYASFYAFFKKEAETYNATQLLKKYLPQLMSGVGASAFHPLIRLSYALTLNDYIKQCKATKTSKLAAILAEEMIICLAYWADSYLTLPILHNAKPIAILLSEMKHCDGDPSLSNLSLIPPRMIQAAKSSSYQELAVNLTEQTDLYKPLAQATIDLYANHPNFTFLHAFTATHALKAILPYLDEQLEAVNHFWRAIVAAYLTVNKATQCDYSLQPKVILNWDDILLSVRCSQDAHIIKATYSAYFHAQSYDAEKAHQIATRFLTD